MSVLPTCVYAHHVHGWVLGGRKMPYNRSYRWGEQESWELNPFVPRQQQQALFTAESSLQPGLLLSFQYLVLPSCLPSLTSTSRPVLSKCAALPCSAIPVTLALGFLIVLRTFFSFSSYLVIFLF